MNAYLANPGIPAIQAPVAAAAVTFTATFMAEMIRRDPVPGALQGNRLARMMRDRDADLGFHFPRCPPDGSKSTQPGPGT